MDNAGWLTVAELARELKVNPRTIQREIKRGNIDAKRVGHKFLFSRAEVEKYLNQGNNNHPHQIEDFLTDHKSDMISLLQKLVSMPSETDTAYDEERLAQHLRGVFEKFGIRSVLVGKGDGVAVHATVGLADEGILLDCPLDTTPVGDISKWNFPPYEGAIRDHKMYGRGTADAKAGMVAMIYAALALKELGIEEAIRVEVVFDGGEQNGAYAGLRNVLSRGLGVKMGIIGYAGDEHTLGIGCRGYHRYTFTIHGKAAHTGSRFNVGVNAISKMAKLVIALEKMKLPHNTQAHFTGSRITTAIVNGGRAINMVPDECILRVDVRTLPKQNKGIVDRSIHELLKELKSEDPDFNVDVTYDLGQEGYYLSKGRSIVDSLQGAITSVWHKAPTLIAHGPAHVGTLLHEHGIPMVVWGPVGGNVHSYDEYVEIESIHKTAIVYAQTVLNYFDLI